MSTYSDLLKDLRWQKRRLEIFERDAFTCRKCDAKHKPLHVHHIIYFERLEPWNYPAHLLITFCEPCHTAEEQNKFTTEAQFIETLRGLGATNGDIERMMRIIRETSGWCGPLATLSLVQESLDAMWSDLSNRGKK